MKRILASVLVAVSPVMALAQSNGYNPGQGVAGLFDLAGYFLNRAVPFIISIAVVYFIFNVFKYAVLSGGDEEKKKEAKTQMIWGIVALFVMVSVWGLVAILQATFGTSGVTSNIGSQLPRF
ncbi:MAG: hypothetical protein WC933_00650 [Candidatus Paceibacterota bacterium]|jgi:hypothetical protein